MLEHVDDEIEHALRTVDWANHGADPAAAMAAIRRLRRVRTAQEGERAYNAVLDAIAHNHLLSAACAEVFGGYGSDGDGHWTPTAVREWWRDRQRLFEWIYRARDRWHGSPHIEERDLYAGLVGYHTSLLDGSLEAYLRGYLFWLDNHRPPATNDLSPPL